jgi:hypothetical protein
MSLERSPLQIYIEGKGRPSQRRRQVKRSQKRQVRKGPKRPKPAKKKRPVSDAEKARRISKGVHKARFKISRSLQKPGAQRKRAKTHKENLRKNKVEVGGKLVAKSQAKRERKKVDRRQRKSRTGAYTNRRGIKQSSRREAYNIIVEAFQVSNSLSTPW